MKRYYCSCPYCPWVSVSYRRVKLHVEFVHPEQELKVGEHYFEMPPGEAV